MTLPLQDVRAIDSAGGDIDDNFTRCCDGIRDRLPAQHRSLAGCGYDDRLHASGLFLTVRECDDQPVTVHELHTDSLVREVQLPISYDPEDPILQGQR